MESDRGRVWRAQGWMELDAWLGRINALLIMDNGRKEEVWARNFRGLLLITGKNGLQQRGHNVFRLMALVEIPVFNNIVWERESSSPRERTGSHEFLYYPAPMRSNCQAH